jgi:hypothetical protein
MPVKNQVERIFKKHFAKINNAIDISNGDIINDISDGEIYRNLVLEDKITRDSFTFLMNVDGISLCDKSKQSIWPVILVLIQLPKEIRYCLQNVIIAGIILVICLKHMIFKFHSLLRSFSRDKT